MPFGGTTPEQDKKIDSCISQISGTNKQTGKPFTQSEKVSICKSQVMGTKGDKKFCFESNIELKAVDTETGKEYHITGFVSAPYVDDVGDYIPEGLQSKIVDRIDKGFANRASGNHDFVLEGNLLPVASGKAELRDHPKIKLKSAWVDVTLDKDSPKFPEIKQHYDNNTIKGFSIEYTEDPQSHHEVMNGQTVRVFDDVPIFGFGIIGGDYAPINPMASADGFEYKAYFESKPNNIKKTKVNPMSETEIELKAKAELKAKEEAELKAKEEDAKAKKEAEAKKKADEEAAKKKGAEGKAEPDFEAMGRQVHAEKQLATKNAELKAMASEMIKAEIKSIKQPYLNPASKFDDSEKGPFATELKSWREVVADPKADIELKYQAAAQLHNSLISTGITHRSMTGVKSKQFQVSGSGMQNLEIKGFEDKAQL